MKDMKALESADPAKPTAEEIEAKRKWNEGDRKACTVMISYLIRNRYDFIIMDSFSFQHSFVCFLHYFFLLLHIATFYAIYR